MKLTKTEEETLFQQIRFLNDSINNTNATIRSIKRMEGIEIDFNLIQAINRFIVETQDLKTALILERNKRKDRLKEGIIRGVVPQRYLEYIR